MRQFADIFQYSDKGRVLDLHLLSQTGASPIPFASTHKRKDDSYPTVPIVLCSITIDTHFW